MLVAPGWLVLGVALHLANQVARGRGWHAAVARAGAAPRARDSILAWVAGAGAGGVVSARGGDAVRIALLRRRLEPGSGALLAGTLVAESAGELSVSVVLLATAVALGVGPRVGLPGSMLLALAGALVVLIATVVLLGRRFPRVRAAARRAAHGCTCLRTPGYYGTRVLPWQLLSRLFRLLALACFLAAFGLPATPLAVLLVVFAQGSGRLVPFAPASVGAGVAILAATFAPLTGVAVSATRVAAFYVGVSTVLTVVGTAIALAICLRDLQASASAGRRAVLGLWMRTRAAIAPRP